MRNRPSLPLILGLSLVYAGLSACGDDSKNTSAGDGDSDTAGDGDGDPTGDGDGTPGDGDGTPGDGDGTPGDGDGTPGDGDGAPGDGDGAPGDGDGAPSCMAWEIVYDLTGSEFELDDTPLGAGDQVNTVEEPYNANDHIGPGHIVLHFQDIDGSPGGHAFIHSYEMKLNFVVSGGGVTVTTDLDTWAGPEECGVTDGPLVNDDVAWTPSAMVDHRSMGTILCQGIFCMQGGLPNGMPVNIDDTDDQPISDFEFSNDLTSFTMDKTVIQMDSNSTTTWLYEGTEISRELVGAPDCLCR